jgi:regulation of enolase protein 1 (concanavalin A-like superfamily)
MTSVTVPGVPFPLAPQGAPACGYEIADGALRLTAQPRTDLFVDPAGGVEPPDAGRLAGFPPAGDFTLTARVRVEFASTYDAGVLLVHAGERRWAKLCFEYSPQKAPTAVTVVTRGSSDDANAFTVDAREPLWLRITRSGRAWAFHASTDGAWWGLLRYFSLHEEESDQVSVGLMAQSPTGPGCSAVFDRISFGQTAPADLRDGS